MSRFFSAFGTAFIAIGIICAPLAAFATFVLYVLVEASRGEVGTSVIGGLATALLAAVLLALTYSGRYQTAAAVNAREIHDLTARLSSASRLFTSSGGPPAGEILRSVAWQTAGDLIQRLSGPDGRLQKKGPGWLAAESYLEAWSDIYSIEEALILLVPFELAVTMANDDLARLAGSNIPTADVLRKRLESALHRHSSGSDAMAIRLEFQAVRRMINLYRSEQWGALVDERNHTLLAASFAGLFAYLGLLLVVVWNIDTKALLVAMSFVITGALVSLLHQLTSVGGVGGGLEDFGQSTARLLTATLVSGVIAVVAIIALEGASLTVNGAPLLKPSPHWRETFDWTQNKSGFFFAALFGFAPSLLFEILQRRADGIKSNLGSSQATGAAPRK